MVIKYDTLNERMKRHVKESKHFTVEHGNIVLHGKYCDTCMIVNQLIREGAISDEELVGLLQ